MGKSTTLTASSHSSPDRPHRRHGDNDEDDDSEEGAERPKKASTRVRLATGTTLAHWEIDECVATFQPLFYTVVC
jgi:hypothetical protein